MSLNITLYCHFLVLILGMTCWLPTRNFAALALFNHSWSPQHKRSFPAHVLLINTVDSSAMSWILIILLSWAQLSVFSRGHVVWVASQDVDLCQVFSQFHHLKEISPWRTFCPVPIWIVFLLCWGTAVTIETSFPVTWEFLLTLVSVYFFLSFWFSSFLAYPFILVKSILL